MDTLAPKFAESSGISSLGINLKGFLFQLITFVIVLLILRRYVFPKLVATLEARRSALEQSLAQAPPARLVGQYAELRDAVVTGKDLDERSL